MPLFPVFISIENKKVVVIGGGKVALRKVEKLLPFNPKITLIAPRVDTRLYKMEREGKIKIKKRKFLSKDIENAYLVISATDNPSLNRRISKLASKKKILCNIVDNPALCTFIFPALVVKGDLCIGITTSGKAPSVSKFIRQLVEQTIPINIEELINKYRKNKKAKLW